MKDSNSCVLPDRPPGFVSAEDENHEAGRLIVIMNANVAEFLNITAFNANAAARTFTNSLKLTILMVAVTTTAGRSVPIRLTCG